MAPQILFLVFSLVAGSIASPFALPAASASVSSPSPSSSPLPAATPTDARLPFNPGGPMKPTEAPFSSRLPPSLSSPSACTYTLSITRSRLPYCAAEAVRTIYPSTTTALYSVACDGCAAVEVYDAGSSLVRPCPDIASTSVLAATPSTVWQTVCSGAAVTPTGSAVQP